LGQGRREQTTRATTLAAPGRIIFSKTSSRIMHN
jgi:hypothetical protein